MIMPRNQLTVAQKLRQSPFFMGVLGLVLIIVVVAVGFSLRQPRTVSVALDSMPNQTADAALSSPMPIFSSQPFADILTQFCTTAGLPMSESPFLLQPPMKIRYGVADTVPCVGRTGVQYLALFSPSVSTETAAPNQVILYHEDTVYDAVPDLLGEPDAVFSLGAMQYGVIILEPGPYGISDKGISLYVIKDLPDSVTGMKVRLAGYTTISTDETANLVQVHGIEYDGPADPNAPEFLLDITQRKEFLSDLSESLQNTAGTLSLAVQPLIQTMESDTQDLVYQKQ